MEEQEKKKALWRAWQAAGVSRDLAKKLWAEMNAAHDNTDDMEMLAFTSNLQFTLPRGVNAFKVEMAMDDFYRQQRNPQPCANVPDNPFAACNRGRSQANQQPAQRVQRSAADIEADIKRFGKYGENMDYS